MPLPAPAERKPLHRRTISFEGFVRGDGMWEIEGRLVDRRAYDSLNHRDVPKPAGAPVHDMSVRLTLDDERRVVDAVACMDTVPYGSCHEVPDIVRALIGAQIGPGWKQAVHERMPMREGCTHLAELTVTLATAVYQLQAFGKHPEGTNPWPAMRGLAEPGHFMGKCHTWQRDSEATRELFPLLYQPTPPR